MGFAHFGGSDSGFAGAIRRRTGEPMLVVSQVTAATDSVLLSGESNQSLKGAWSGDTFTGVLPVRWAAPDSKKSTAPPSEQSMRLS